MDNVFTTSNWEKEQELMSYFPKWFKVMLSIARFVTNATTGRRRTF